MSTITEIPPDPALGGLWVFAMNDCDWVMARSLEAAIEAYGQDYGGPDFENDTAEACALTAEDMDRLEYVDQEEDTEEITEWRTFRQQLAKLVAEGKTKARLFATTEI